MIKLLKRMELLFLSNEKYKNKMIFKTLIEKIGKFRF